MNRIYFGDSISVLQTLESDSVDCCVTSPPYWMLRDYDVQGQYGIESTPYEYVDTLVKVFNQVRRVLKPTGTFWLNIGDSYADSKKLKQTNDWKPKELIGIPWMVAFALRRDGWYLRQEIIWYKESLLPESAKDRCTRAHEQIFLFVKSFDYYFDWKSIREPAKYDGRKDTVMKGSQKYTAKVIPGQQPHTVASRGHERWQRGPNGEFLRNKRDVWPIPTATYSGAHYAPFPEEIPRTCILAGCPEDGVVLDPFIGSGTTALVAAKLGRKFIGIELDESNKKCIQDRMYEHSLFCGQIDYIDFEQTEGK